MSRRSCTATVFQRSVRTIRVCSLVTRAITSLLSRGDHFTFIETIPPVPEKRNPQVFRGKYITVTRREDGTYRPNFKPMKVGADFSIAQFASDVANELLWALDGLVEKKP